MQPDPQYTELPSHFWAYVGAVSERLTYSERGSTKLRRYSHDELVCCLKSLGIPPRRIKGRIAARRALVELLMEYLNRRAELLEAYAKPNLMDRNEARKAFSTLKRRHRPTCKLPMNKQKGSKKHENYLVCIANILTEATLGGCNFDADPQRLATIMRRGELVCTMSRRLDGAYPSVEDPCAVWEVKEYYGTTTFGSRIADGVYETALDGRELQDLRREHKIHVKHYLLVDDRFIWWRLGRSYLCRIADMLHRGLVDEVLFGREVVERWPGVVKSWPKP